MDYEIVLAAPRHYIEGYPGLDGFPVQIAHEDIAAAIAELDPTPRGQYRADFIGTASTKGINAWKPQRDEATDAFWGAAYRIATAEFPVLEMKPLRVTKGSTWINLRPRDMPTMPKRIYISLKGDRGFVDLTFSRTTAHKIHQQVNGVLLDGMSIHQTGEAAAIRIETDGFATNHELELSLRRIRSAFSASARLIEFYRKNWSELDEAASRATPI